MDKVLTISIAAYNAEDSIRKAIESLLVPEIMDRIEVFVIDDGGSDHTLQIAQEYHRQYPESIHAVHKENGGYGSTVNYSIRNASGKYLRLLDGDDFYRKEGLKELVDYLETHDTDLVITDYLEGSDENGWKKISYADREGFEEKILKGFVPKDYFGMWPMTVKTSVLRKSRLKLPEHRLYTDQFFATVPLAYARTIVFLDTVVYCYRTGGVAQSTSRQSRIRHFQETLENSTVLTRFCRHHQRNPNYPCIVQRTAAYHRGAVNTLLLLPAGRESLKLIRQQEKKIRRLDPNVYKEAEKRGETGVVLAVLRRTGYITYWPLKLLLGWK